VATGTGTVTIFTTCYFNVCRPLCVQFI